MRILLSIRDNNSAIVKEAMVEEFISGFAKNTWGKLQLRTKPFETLFRFLGPMMFAKTLFGKAILMIAESYGFGPGLIGKFIDDALGFGDPNSVPTVSDSDIQNVSQKISDKILSPIGMASMASLDVKTANSRRGILSRIFSSVSQGGKFSPVNLIASIIGAFVKGLLGLGIIGGVKEVLTGPSRDTDTTDTSRQQYPSTNYQQYSNVKGNVAETLITYLDATVEKFPQLDGSRLTFSEEFQKLRNQDLLGSTELSNILADIRILNESTPIEELDMKKTFVGPSVKSMVQNILPELKYEDIKPQELQKPPKKYRPQKMQISDKSDKERLKSLLEGVL